METAVKVKMVSCLECPNCGAEEIHPSGKGFLIRAFKVSHDGRYWWSQCLVCAGYYDDKLKPTGNEPEGGWF